MGNSFQRIPFFKVRESGKRDWNIYIPGSRQSNGAVPVISMDDLNLIVQFHEFMISVQPFKKDLQAMACVFLRSGAHVGTVKRGNLHERLHITLNLCHVQSCGRVDSYGRSIHLYTESGPRFCPRSLPFIMFNTIWREEGGWSKRLTYHSCICLGTITVDGPTLRLQEPGQHDLEISNPRATFISIPTCYMAITT